MHFLSPQLLLLCAAILHALVNAKGGKTCDDDSASPNQDLLDRRLLVVVRFNDNLFLRLFVLVFVFCHSCTYLNCLTFSYSGFTRLSRIIVFLYINKAFICFSAGHFLGLGEGDLGFVSYRAPSHDPSIRTGWTDNVYIVCLIFSTYIRLLIGSQTVEFSKSFCLSISKPLSRLPVILFGTRQDLSSKYCSKSFALGVLL